MTLNEPRPVPLNVALIWPEPTSAQGSEPVIVESCCNEPLTDHLKRAAVVLAASAEDTTARTSATAMPAAVQTRHRPTRVLTMSVIRQKNVAADDLDTNAMCDSTRIAPARFRAWIDLANRRFSRGFCDSFREVRFLCRSGRRLPCSQEHVAHAVALVEAEVRQAARTGEGSRSHGELQGVAPCRRHERGSRVVGVVTRQHETA